MKPRYTKDAMTDLEQDIFRTLRELEAGVAAMRTAVPKPDLLSLFGRLSGYCSQLPRESHAQLIHYLSNGSYEKARLWLQGRDSENLRGLCGR